LPGTHGHPRFDHALLAGLDEPVQRYLRHAVADGAPLPRALRLSMSGRIRAGRWLPFTAEQRTTRSSFAWTARVGPGPLTLLEVADAYADGKGSTRGRLFGRLPVFGAADADTARSAAGRAALEAVAFAPATLLAGDGVTWRAERDDLIAASWQLPPERPEVRVALGPAGAPRSVSALRWGDDGEGGHAYVPCGCDVHGERRFGAFTVPGSVTVSWWWGTPRRAPFFRAAITGCRADP
jgi:uncharacterized protein DUF6544